MKLYPKQEEFLQMLETLPPGLRQAKAIWGQNSGKSVLLEEFIKSKPEITHHVVVLGKDTATYSSLNNVVVYGSISELCDKFKVQPPKGKNPVVPHFIESIIVEDFDFMDVASPVTSYNALVKILKDSDALDTYLIFLGSLGKTNSSTKRIFNNVGIEQVFATWDVVPGLDIGDFNAKFAEDATETFRDFGSVYA